MHAEKPTFGIELIRPMRWIDGGSSVAGGPRGSGWSVYQLSWSCGCGYVGITSHSVERRVGQHLGSVDMRGRPVLPERTIAERVALKLGRIGVIHHASVLGGTVEVVATDLGEREARAMERALISELARPLNIVDADGRTIERCEEAQYDAQIARLDDDELEAAFALKRSVETWVVLNLGAKLHIEAATAWSASGACDLAAELLERRYELPSRVEPYADIAERYTAKLRITESLASGLALEPNASQTPDADGLCNAVETYARASSAAHGATARCDDLSAQLRDAEDKLLETDEPSDSAVEDYRAALHRSSVARLHANSMIDAYVTAAAELGGELGIAAANLMSAAMGMLNSHVMYEDAERLASNPAQLYGWAAKELLDADVDPQNWRGFADETLRDAASICADASGIVTDAVHELREAARQYVEGLDKAAEAVGDSGQESLADAYDIDAAATVRHAALLYADVGAALREAASLLNPAETRTDLRTVEEPW